jgi:hypothetical protein
VEELTEPMHRDLQSRRIEEAQAQILQRSIAQWPTEDTRHFIVEFAGQQAIQRGKLLLRNTGSGFVK